MIAVSLLMFTNVALVMVGGALGSLGRYLVQNFVGQASFGHTWAVELPLGTLAVNIAGCLVIGLLGALGENGLLREEMRLFLMTGVLGGFTTFSAFGLESTNLFLSGHPLRAVSYALLSTTLGIGTALIAFKMVRH